MNILLDTHIFLWWMNNDKRLSEEKKAAIDDPENTIFFSVASAWEMSIKKALGKLKTPNDLEEVLMVNDFILLDVKIAHAVYVEKLPNFHADPFDRMLVAQAKIENLILLTHDKNIEKYDMKKIMI